MAALSSPPDPERLLAKKKVGLGSSSRSPGLFIVGSVVHYIKVWFVCVDTGNYTIQLSDTNNTWTKYSHLVMIVYNNSLYGHNKSTESIVQSSAFAW